jgi:hypothetical protein
MKQDSDTALSESPSVIPSNALVVNASNEIDDDNIHLVGFGRNLYGRFSIYAVYNKKTGRIGEQ